ncbi:MAG: hypothetical protein JST16_05610 [Bdellovibrionales bacterium]|nr:hypothetical protein [Bdellovibrionales bacterium]
MSIAFKFALTCTLALSLGACGDSKSSEGNNNGGGTSAPTGNGNNTPADAGNNTTNTAPTQGNAQKLVGYWSISGKGPKGNATIQLHFTTEQLTETVTCQFTGNGASTVAVQVPVKFDDATINILQGDEKHSKDAAGNDCIAKLPTGQTDYSIEGNTLNFGGAKLQRVMGPKR